MKKLLLIVEDNPEMAESLQEFLSDLVDEVIIASSVDEAQDYLLSKTFSLITLDINLRGRNGSEVIKFLFDNSENPNKNVPIIVISGMVSEQFIEKNKTRFAGVFGKPFHIDELVESATKALNAKIIKQEVLELASFDKIPFLKCKLDLSISQFEERALAAVTQIKRYPNPKAILASIKCDYNPDKYFAYHSNILMKVLLGLAIQLEWNTDKTLTKLALAAYLHDIALAEKLQLSKIDSFQQLEEQRSTLGAANYKLVFEHPNMAATTLSGYGSIDEDIVTIIRQHHEQPDGSGYPGKITHKKIIPLSTLFIVAHDFTNYIMETPQWNLDKYIIQAKAKYSGLVFLKTIAALSTLK
jgi:response regulator RpfG family c-di-GMP phosphodiesterase